MTLFNNTELYGIVLNNHVTNKNGTDQIVIAIFDIGINPIENQVDDNSLLIEPQVVSKKYWTIGLFETVFKEFKNDIIIDYGFYELGFNRFCDEYGKILSKEPKHLELSGVCTIHGIAFNVIRELIIRYNIDLHRLN